MRESGVLTSCSCCAAADMRILAAGCSTCIQHISTVLTLTVVYTNIKFSENDSGIRRAEELVEVVDDHLVHACVRVKNKVMEPQKSAKMSVK